MTDASETLSIDAFVEARLAEDEQLARAAAEAHGQDWFPVDAEYGDSPDRVEGTGDGAVGYDMYETVPPHIARHDPARVLREVARNRRVLKRHRKFEPSDGVLIIGIAGSGDVCAGCGMRNGHQAWPCAEARDLASIWSSHPDFRAEWSA